MTSGFFLSAKSREGHQGQICVGSLLRAWEGTSPDESSVGLSLRYKGVRAVEVGLLPMAFWEGSALRSLVS